jgi:hypothetical protein
VQDDGRGGGAEHFAVDAAVVVGGCCGPGEVAAGHQHRPRSLLLGEVQLLLVGADDRVHRDRLRIDMIGVHADHDRAALFTGDLRGA